MGKLFFFVRERFFNQHVDVINPVVVVVLLFCISCLIAIHSYAELSKATLDRLPAKDDVIAFVTRGVKSCTENKSHLASSAVNVHELTMVQAFVWNWWRFPEDARMEILASHPLQLAPQGITRYGVRSVNEL